MELQFPETLSVRLSSNKNLLKAEKATKKKERKEEFKFAGTLDECNGYCGFRCNMC